jgi:hypothetical protein
VAGESEEANGPVWQGVAVEIDLPAADHRQNASGKPDRPGRPGAGLCVWAAIDMISKWEGIEELNDLFEWMKTQPGGGWPERVERVLKERAPVLVSEGGFIQYEGTDPSILDATIARGRPIAVTYGYGDWYRDKGVTLDANGLPRIDHMVLLVHIDTDWACIIDSNNSTYYTWMSRKEFLKRWVYPDDRGWAVALFGPPPPPVPTN